MRRIPIEPASPHHPRVLSEPLIGLAWLWRIRWGTVALQAAAIAVAGALLELDLPNGVLLAIVASTAGSNLALPRLPHSGDTPTRTIAGVLVLDVLIHTALLYFSGGAANPFSALFAIYVAIAALLLDARWTVAMVALTSLSFGALFLVPVERLGPHALHLATPMHLQGMWVAYVLSATLVALFVFKVANALRRRERELLELTAYTGRVERIASLSTLAAGAAHELGSPLASIAVSATELSEQLDDASLAAEARHIREQVTRCREIIDRLSSGIGQQPGEAIVSITYAELATRVRLELGSRRAERVRFEGAEDTVLHCPPRGLVQTLVNLITNAIDATASERGDELTVVSLKGAADELCFEVADRGPGIAEEVAAKLGEPFFTTKAPGEGMGLGLYVAALFVRQMAGSLELASTNGVGTCAVLRIPVLHNAAGARA